MYKVNILKKNFRFTRIQNFFKFFQTTKILSIISLSLLVSSCYAKQIKQEEKTIYSFNNTVCGYKKHNIIYADNVEKMNMGFQHLKDFSQPTAILFDLTKLLSFPTNKTLTTHMRNVYTDLLIVYYDKNKYYISFKIAPSLSEHLYNIPTNAHYFVEYPLQNEFFNKNINEEIPFNLNFTTCF